MKVFIKNGFDNQIANHNFYAAYDGFRQMGLEILYFENIEELTENTHYGLFSLDYAKLLSARWSELTSTIDECDF
ncbi:hypothetical protein [Paenibacillus alba]|uniref:Uncharacterized protein n=1 Tax=Paenibacillus alba TaxID=1197127 RepID=A0ABU6GCM0_9BACL|nr:hypothetical protein [Paenibacillus alba]MEC0231934.1 hypothetical protein [Paenibacillus alba]